jgi:hypothetical protein
MIINPRYNLPRARIIYAKRLGGKSYNYLSRVYEMSPQSIRDICQVFERYLLAGLVEKPEAIYE